MIPSVTAIQWKYFRRADNTFPIKIRVTYRQNSKYYPIQFEGELLCLTPEQWSECKAESSGNRRLKAIRNEVIRCEAEARALCEDLTLKGKRPFSFAQFQQQYAADKPTSFLGLFQAYLEGLIREERLGTYRTYLCAKSALERFLGKSKDIETHELTPEFLMRFERHLLSERGVNRNTVAIYMRTLKVIYNFALASTPSLLEFYPFARKRNDKTRYQIRTASGKKGQALPLDDLRRFVQIDLKQGSPQWLARQFWLFSFYSQGMNFRDIALLRVENYNGEHIHYVRHKTRNTEFHEVPMIVPVTPAIRQIVETLVTGRVADDFLFDILSPQMQPMEIEKAVMQKIKVTNKWLKRICKGNALPAITTYWARHTYASLLKDSGQSMDTIREMLGHSSLRTTQAYLNRLEASKAMKINVDLQRLVTAQ